MRAAPAHALDDGLKGHVDFKHVVELDPGRLHGVGLGDGAGEAIEEETVGAIRLCNAFLDEANDDVVTDQRTGVHHGLGLQPQRRSGLHCGA